LPNRNVGTVSILARGIREGYVDARGTNAEFSDIYGLCFDEVEQAIFVCDYHNSKIRKVSVSGMVVIIMEK